jgi:hypothetical protein
MSSEKKHITREHLEYWIEAMEKQLGYDGMRDWLYEWIWSVELDSGAWALYNSIMVAY